MKFLISFVFCFSFVLPIFTQNINEIPFIEVYGVSELEVIPDEIYVNIIIRERIENKERITLDVQEKNFKELLKKINIDINNLSLENANSDYVKLKIKQKEVLSQVSYSLKLSTAKEVNDLFNGLYEIKIYDANIYKVNHSKIDDYKRDLRIKAIKDAKEKAVYLTKAIGNDIGKPLVINESYPIEFDGVMPALNRSYKIAESEEYSEASQEMSFKKIKILSKIYIKYELK